ncbi:hypothetical protein BST61_g4399 [Cercospora zeina]
MRVSLSCMSPYDQTSASARQTSGGLIGCLYGWPGPRRVDLQHSSVLDSTSRHYDIEKFRTHQHSGMRGCLENALIISGLGRKRCCGASTACRHSPFAAQSTRKRKSFDTYAKRNIATHKYLPYTASLISKSLILFENSKGSKVHSQPLRPAPETHKDHHISSDDLLCAAAATAVWHGIIAT